MFGNYMKNRLKPDAIPKLIEIKEKVVPNLIEQAFINDHGYYKKDIDKGVSFDSATGMFF